MNANLDWRDARQAADELAAGAGDYRCLYLLSRLPLLPQKGIERLGGDRGGASVYRSLQWLAIRGLVDSIRPPLSAGLSPRLFHLTDLGLATVAVQEDEDPTDLARRARLRRTDLLAAMPGLPQLMAAYELLGALAVALPRPPDRVAWERPWRRRYQRPTAKEPVGVALPAHAELAWEGGAGRFLLLPDLGGIPLRAHRSRIGHLLALRNVRPEQVPVLVIATTGAARQAAWQDLLQDMARWHGEAPLQTCTALWDDLVHGLEAAPYLASAAGAMTLGPTDRATTGRLQDRTRTSRPPKLVGSTLTSWAARPIRERQGEAALRLSPSDRMLLDVLARHPFLTTEGLAELLGSPVESVRDRRAKLIDRGLILTLEPDRILGAVQETELHEVSLLGLQIVAAQQGLRLGEAVHYNGLAGGGPDRPVGAREELLANLRHTLEVNNFFLDLIRVGQRLAATGSDDALEEWRNEKACSRGRFRPDGYGIYRHQGRRYAFFLEYDRGTMDTRALTRKFDGYYDYRAGGGFVRDYQGFPTILVVTPDYAAEERIMRGLLASSVGRSVELPVLTTTMEQIEQHPMGLLGPIWRTPEKRDRRYWPLDPLVLMTVRRKPAPTPIGSRVYGSVMSMESQSSEFVTGIFDTNKGRIVDDDRVVEGRNGA